MKSFSESKTNVLKRTRLIAVTFAFSIFLSGCATEVSPEEQMTEACRLLALAQDSPLSADISNARFDYYAQAAEIFRTLSLNNSEFASYAKALSSSAMTKGGGLFMEDFYNALGFCGLA